jgi:tetratricopeptide (TPR) repeat protein
MPQHAATASSFASSVASSFPASNVFRASLAFALEAHRAGKFCEAEALYREALAAWPEHPNALHYYGVLQHQRGHHTLALQYLEFSFELDPDNAECWNDRRFVAAALHEPELALRCYRVSVGLDPRSADAHNNLEVALEGEGRLNEAVYHYRAALRIDPTLADVHLNLGCALDRLMQFDDADVHYRAMLSLNAHTANVCLKARSNVINDAFMLTEHALRQHSANDPPGPAA